MREKDTWKYISDEDRIMRVVEVDAETGCWNWLGTTSRGYGYIHIHHKQRIAHRFAYETFVGPIPGGLQIDHLCRNRVCVNPAHLEPVTQRENILRSESITAKHARKTHCPRGHAYTPENTSVWRGQRKCKACHRERQRARRLSTR